MAAEALAHGREDLVGEVVEAPGGEAGVERGGEDGGGNALVDGGDRGPAAFARVRDPAGEFLELGRGVRGPRPSGRAARTRPPSPGARLRSPPWCRCRTGRTRAPPGGPSRRLPSALVLPMLALWRMFRPSANEAIIPYSIPLWTIFTKWPAPLGPQWRKPCSAVSGSPCAPGSGARRPRPGAMVAKMGFSRSTTPSSPPIMRQKPRSIPHTPPDGPAVDVVDAPLARAARPGGCRRGSRNCRRR